MALKWVPFSEEHRKKIWLSNRWKKHSDESKEKMRIAKIWILRSEETRKKLSEARKWKSPWNKWKKYKTKAGIKQLYKECLICWKSFTDNKWTYWKKWEDTKYCSIKCFWVSQIGIKKQPHTEESKKKVSERHKWKILSEETKRKMAISKMWENNPLFWKKRTEESIIKQKEKISWEKSIKWKGWLPECTDCWKQLTNYWWKKCVICDWKSKRWEKCRLWKWWISLINKTFRQLAMEKREYKVWRKSVFERDNHTCIECLKRWWTLNADHIKTWSEYPELRYDINNWRTLCIDCHRKTDTYWWRYLKNNQ